MACYYMFGNFGEEFLYAFFLFTSYLFLSNVHFPLYILLHTHCYVYACMYTVFILYVYTERIPHVYCMHILNKYINIGTI